MSEKECYISVDVEASGPVPGDFSLLAIGACVVDRPLESFYCELKPISNRFIPEALKVSGFSLDDLATQGQDPREALQAFAAWLEATCDGSQPIMVGFNATFDWSFVNWYFVHYGVPNPFGIGAIDIKSYYMGLAGTAWADTRSSRIPDMFQPSHRQSHNALDDAIAQGEMFSRMILAAKESRLR